MTTLIDAVQKQDPGSGLIELFELILDNSTTLYFHSGVEADLSSVQFRDKTSPYTTRTYTAIPIEMKGIERKTDGASARPTLTVANVLATFSDAIDMTNKDLIGKRLIRRTTLQRYLVGEADDASPPIEFPTEKFIIDRIASENKVAIIFELAAASDLEGVKLPNRIVVGKYCSWEYQGTLSNSRGGCIWPTNSKILVAGTEYKAYFNIKDEPIVSASLTYNAYSASTGYNRNTWVTHAGNTWRSDVGAGPGDSSANHTGNTPAYGSTYWTRAWPYTVYSASATYTYDKDDHTYVEYNDTIWKTVRAITTAGQTPVIGSNYWVRGDLCGKILGSCKCRFQFQPDSGNNNLPSTDKNTEKVLPFGGFPGSEKYR
jgi:lambda family phage minor tail protein L